MLSERATGTLFPTDEKRTTLNSTFGLNRHWTMWQVTEAEEVRNKKHQELKTQLDGAKSSILEAQTGRNYS